jgi:L-ascorbate metabolism protein UlaG (beta-lactamase superfamily)
MRLRLIRHATLRLEAGGLHLLVDPMLDPAGARPPVEGTENDRRNPLVELPEPAEIVVEGVDAVLVSHLHEDHFDATAAELLPPDVPLLCQPEDAATLGERGFTDVRPVEDELTLGPLTVVRTPARHGYGADAEALAPVSGFLVREDGASLYLAGDTVFYPGVETVLDAHRPTVVVVNASGARFTGGRPIVMDLDDVVAVARRVPDARVVAVHLDAINHCIETRADLHQRLADERLTGAVSVPEDGAAVPLD